MAGAVGESERVSVVIPTYNRAALVGRAVRDASGAEHRRYLSRWNPGLPPWSWAEVLGPGVPFSSLAPLPPGRDDFPVYTGDLYPAQLDRLFVLTTTLLVRRSTAGSALH